jgi:hypothetical protein
MGLLYRTFFCTMLCKQEDKKLGKEQYDSVLYACYFKFLIGIEGVGRKPTQETLNFFGFWDSG